MFPFLPSRPSLKNYFVFYTILTRGETSSEYFRKSKVASFELSGQGCVTINLITLGFGVATAKAVAYVTGHRFVISHLASKTHIRK